MAVCDLCKGTGRLLKPWYDTTGLMTGFTGDICFKCDGKGTIGEPQTNEEWFCSLPTEEKAKAIVDVFLDDGEWNEYIDRESAVEIWLKEVHKE